MNERTLEILPVNQLWHLRDKINALLAEKIVDEQKTLDLRLAQLRGQPKARRPYPKVYPKYQNPDRPSQTWSGRGLRPHSFVRQLNAGRTAEDLRIQSLHTNQ